jgi:hypothetical protein
MTVQEEQPIAATEIPLIKDLPESSPTKAPKRKIQDPESSESTNEPVTKQSKPNTEVYEAVLLDIEGTTTPITFVHDVLFPYVRNHMVEFLEKHWDDAECQERIHDLRLQVGWNRDI